MYGCSRSTCKGSQSSSCWRIEYFTNMSNMSMIEKCGLDELLCASGSHGALCGSCSNGFSYSSSEKKCKSCNNSNMAPVFVLIALVLFACLVALLLPRGYTPSKVLFFSQWLQGSTKCLPPGTFRVLWSNYQVGVWFFSFCGVLPELTLLVPRLLVFYLLFISSFPC